MQSLFPLNILLWLIFVQCYETTDILLFKQSLTRHWKGSHIYSYSANKSIKKIQKYTVYISDAVSELVGLSDIESEGSWIWENGQPLWRWIDWF